MYCSNVSRNDSHSCARLRRERLRYSNVMPAENDAKSGMGRSWKSTLRAETRDEAETRLREIGYDWEWLPDGSLRATTPILPAVYEASSGRKTFFNQLIAAFQGWKDERTIPLRRFALAMVRLSTKTL